VKAEQLKQLKAKVDSIQGLMIAYVTDGRTEAQPSEYQQRYFQLDADLRQLGYPNPNPHRSLEAFWSYCKAQELSTYASRRTYVRELYADVLPEIERALRARQDPRLWKKTREELTDELTPIREQWAKARDYIHSSPADYHNSIKESINSVESAAKILAGEPRATLGKLIREIDIDPDVRRILSQVYGLLSNKPFVRHGAIEPERIGEEEAEFFLELAAISIIYLKRKLSPSDKAAEEPS